MKKLIFIFSLLFISLLTRGQIDIGTNFRMGAQLPIDDRYIFADTNARNSLSSDVRYNGLGVYVTANQKNYQLRGGITNSFWKEYSQWNSSGSNIYYTEGNVGIGTATPTKRLHILGSTLISDTTFTSKLVGGTNVSSKIVYQSTTGTGVATDIAHQFTGGTNGGTAAMTILNNGNAGFGGKTDPVYAIDATGSIRASSTIYATGSSFFESTSLSIGYDGVAQIKNYSTGSNSALAFLTKRTIEAMRITPAQLVGIGTTAPATKLHVKDGAIRAGVTVRADMDSTIYKLTAAGKGVVISTDSAIRLHGTATVWDDLMMPFTTGESAGTGYPTFNADSVWYKFVVDTTGVSKCIIYMPVQMPHKWKEGSTAVYPHIHYHHTTTQGTPTFKVKYKWFNTGALTGDWKWLDMATTTGTTNNTHQMVYSSTGISGSGKTISSMLLCLIYLTGQTGTGGIDAYQFDIHYEINSLGSNSETSKN